MITKTWQPVLTLRRCLPFTICIASRISITSAKYLYRHNKTKKTTNRQTAHLNLDLVRKYVLKRNLIDKLSDSRHICGKLLLSTLVYNGFNMLLYKNVFLLENKYFCRKKPGHKCFYINIELCQMSILVFRLKHTIETVIVQKGIMLV